jgi:hypothetical protein
MPKALFPREIVSKFGPWKINAGTQRVKHLNLFLEVALSAVDVNNAIFFLPN